MKCSLVLGMAILAFSVAGCVRAEQASPTPAQASNTPAPSTQTPRTIPTATPTATPTALPMRPPPSGTTLFLMSGCQCDGFPSERTLVRVRNVGGAAQASVILSVKRSTDLGEPFGIVQAGAAGRSLLVLLLINRIVPAGEPPPRFAEEAMNRFRLLRSDDEGETWRSLGEMDHRGPYLDTIGANGVPLLLSPSGGSDVGNLFRWGSDEVIGTRTLPPGADKNRSSLGNGWWWDSSTTSIVSSAARIQVPGVQDLARAVRNSSGVFAAFAFRPKRELIIFDVSGTILRRSPGDFDPRVWLNSSHVAGWGATDPNDTGPLVFDTATGDLFTVDGLQAIPQPERFFAPIRTIEALR